MKARTVLPILILTLLLVTIVTAAVDSIAGLTGAVTTNPGSGILVTSIGQNLAISVDTAVVLPQTTAIAGTPWQAVDAGGSGTVYSVTLGTSIPGLVDGMMLLFRPNTSCAGGATTLTVNAPASLGTKALVQPDGSSNPTAGECVALITIPITFNQSLKTGAGAWVLPR